MLDVNRYAFANPSDPGRAPSFKVCGPGDVSSPRAADPHDRPAAFYPAKRKSLAL
jgi:hypothetical protein